MRRLPALLLISGLVLPGLALPTPARADAPDPVDFLFRMGMLEGHLMIGQELMQAKQYALGLPHFGHPVEELYEDLEPWLEAHHVAPFRQDLIDLEAAEAKEPGGAAANARYAAMIVTLHRARQSAPESVRASVPEQIRICADTVDAAAGEYAEALNQGRIDSPVEYHDSRGYLAFVAQQMAALRAASPSQAALIDRFDAVLARARAIVAPLLPPETPIATVAEYKAIAADGQKVATP